MILVNVKEGEPTLAMWMKQVNLVQTSFTLTTLWYLNYVMIPLLRYDTLTMLCYLYYIMIPYLRYDTLTMLWYLSSGFGSEIMLTPGQVGPIGESESE